MNAIEFSNVSKKFKKGEKFDSFRDLIPNIAKGIFRPKKADQLEDKEFWALKDVSFEVKKGETLGIIGPNGSGKSTTLKLLSRILRPTMGDIKINGRLSALIEVGAGFHPDLTGRENIYLNGAIIGMRRREIDKKFDQIVEFSELNDFIDTPVKRYSSGMYVRLGFSVAAHLDPDILLIDEILSVGDMNFQHKCSSYIKGLVDRGVTIIIISHNFLLVETLCPKSILLVKGNIKAIGDSSSVIKQFPSDSSSGPEFGKEKHAFTTNKVNILGVKILDLNGSEKKTFKHNEDFCVMFDYVKNDKIECVFGVGIFRDDGVYCYGTATNWDKIHINESNTKGTIKIKFHGLSLLPNKYQISVSAWDKTITTLYELHERQYDFSIDGFLLAHGVVNIKHEWEVISKS